MSKRRIKKISMEPITATIHGLSHEGRGIASIDGKTHFIFGALPGETVSFKLTSMHGKYNEGMVLEVLEPSPHRVTPHCAHFGVCGGCSLQHLRHDQQMVFKQQTVLDQLKHMGKIVPKHSLPPIVGDIWGYRRQSRLGVRFVIKKEKLLLGFREHDGRFLADLSGCEVLDPRVGKHFDAISKSISALHAYDHIPQVEVAMGDKICALIIRHLEPLDVHDQTILTALAKEFNFHLYLQPNKPLPTKKLFPADVSDYLEYQLSHFKLKFEFKVDDFTQVNASVNELLIAKAVELLDVQASDSVLDLFCGLGNFTLPLAQKAKEVVGVEGSEDMVLRGTHNATLNNIHNTSFYAADLFKPLPDAPWAKRRYDKILLDPPRTGAAEIVEHLAKFGAKKIVYVSCNPATLARDSGVLAGHGYVLDSIAIADMFSHTAHVETIALFIQA